MVKNHSIPALKNDIAAFVQAAVPMAQIQDAFSGKQYFGELTEQVVTVSVQKLSVRSGGFENYIGIYADGSGQTDAYGHLCEVSLIIQLLLPVETTEAEGNQMFSEICSALLFQSIYDFEEILCQEMRFEERAQCLLLPIYVKTSVLLSKEGQAVTLNDIKVIRRKKEEG